MASLTISDLFKSVFPEIYTHSKLGSYYKIFSYELDLGKHSLQIYGSHRAQGPWLPLHEDHEVVSWVDNQLKSWKSCKKKNHNTWVFDSQDNAEKFIAWFNLKWVT